MGILDDAKTAVGNLGHLADTAAQKAAEAIGTAAGTTARVGSSITDQAVESARSAADLAKQATDRLTGGASPTLDDSTKG